MRKVESTEQLNPPLDQLYMLIIMYCPTAMPFSLYIYTLVFVS